MPVQKDGNSHDVEIKEEKIDTSTGEAKDVKPLKSEKTKRSREYPSITESKFVESVGGVHGNYFCKECGKTMRNKKDITRHIETHIVGLSYNCPYCGKEAKSKNSLNVHVSTKHKR